MIRTKSEHTKIVFKTISEIRKVKNLTSELITETCLKYDISENHIRNVGGWKNILKGFNYEERQKGYFNKTAIDKYLKIC